LNKEEEIKFYEKENKKAECITRQLTEQEKIKYDLINKINKKEERIIMNIENTELQINKKFKNLLPPLLQEEFNELESLILKDGCTELIKVWKDNISDITYIIDGHNRYDICTKHNIEFRIEEKKFNTQEDVLDWIIKHQFGRRNINDTQKAYLRGLQYENEKKKPYGRSDRNFGTEESSTPKSEEQFQSIKTAERLGQQHQVSERAIREDGKFANALNKISDTIGIEAKNKILNREKLIAKQDVIELGNQIDEGIADIDNLKQEILESEDKKINIPKRETKEVKKGRPPKLVDKDIIIENKGNEDKQVIQSVIQNNTKNIVKDIKILKICLKCGIEKNTTDFNDNMDFCNECLENINEPNIKNEDYSKLEQEKRDVILGMKTEKIATDYIVVSDELLFIKNNIQKQIDIANDKIFERYNLPDKMTEEDVNNFTIYMDEVIIEINNLKNKIININIKGE